MSRSWRSRLRILLTPERVVAETLPAFGCGHAEAQTWSVEGIHDFSWEAPLAILQRQASMLSRSTRIDITVANRYARYAFFQIPPRLNASERQSFLDHKVHQQFGPAAAGWQYRTSSTGAGNVLVAALPSALIDGIRAVTASPGAARVSIQPALTLAFNAWRFRAGATGWFVMVEPGQAVIGRMEQGQWRSLCARLLGGPTPEALYALLDREHLLQSLRECVPDIHLATSEIHTGFIASHADYRVHRLPAPEHPMRLTADHAVAA